MQELRGAIALTAAIVGSWVVLLWILGVIHSAVVFLWF